MEKGSHVLTIILTVLGLVSVILTCIFAFLNSIPVRLDGNSTVSAAPGLYVNTIESFGSKYPSSVNPADWVFAIIWPIIFIWNIIGASYMVASICLPKDRSPIMREPALMPASSLIFFNLSWLFSIGWLFAYDREIMGLALFFLMMAAWTTYVTLGLSYKSYASDILILEEYSNKMLVLVRVLIHNGYAIYATWLTCAWKLNFATVITYVDSRGMDKRPADLIGSLTAEDAGTVVLSLLLFEIVLWFILENFFFEKFCRYTVSIYPALLFAFSGLFVRGYEDNPLSRNNVITLVGLILVVIALPVRIGLVVYRHGNRMRFA